MERLVLLVLVVAVVLAVLLVKTVQQPLQGTAVVLAAVAVADML
jgi:hypothetical protein